MLAILYIATTQINLCKTNLSCLVLDLTIDIILPTDWDWTLGISMYTLCGCARSEFCPLIQAYTANTKLPESKAFCNEITLCLHTDYSLYHIQIIEQ